MKKIEKKELNKKFIASTKVLKNRGKQISKINKPINKQTNNALDLMTVMPAG